MKPLLIPLCFAFLAGGNAFATDDSWEAAKKEAFDATRYIPAAINAATSDLDLDPQFGVAGTNFYDFNASPYLRDWGFRSFDRLEITGWIGTFPIFGSFRYVVGARWHNGTWDAAIARTDPATGALVNQAGTPFATGQLVVPTTLSEAQDVAFDGGSQLYFTGQSSVLLFGPVFTTYCLDIDTGAACAGFSSGSIAGYSYSVFTEPGQDASRWNSIARKIVYDPTGFLFIGGESNKQVGKQLALTKIDANTGHAISSFGTNGQMNLQISGSIDHGMSAMARRPAATPGPDSLYIGGTFQRVGDANDYDGYISRINPTTGGIDDTQLIFHESDNTGNKKDAVTAIAVQADGRIAFAGWSDTDAANVPSTLVGRLLSVASSGLSSDPSMCSGSVCAYSNKGFPGLIPNWYNVAPVAIAERPGNGDLVVSMIYSSPAVGRVEQYSANGSYRTGTSISVPGAAGFDHTWLQYGLTVDDQYVTVTGTREWNASDVDFIVARLKANDSIFADRFEKRP